MGHGTPNTTGDGLQDLAHQIREAVKAAQNSGATVLRHAMKAGDALNQAQQRVSTNWKEWLRGNCCLSPRTAQLYQQLANHRDDIEAEINHVGEIGIRAAVRLVAKSKNTNKSPKKKPPFDALNWWRRASHEERTRLLSKIGVPELIAELPPEMRKELERRAKRGKTERGTVDMRLTKILHTALSHLKSSQDTTDTAAIAALAALRGIARAHSDFHTLTICVTVNEEEELRAA